MAFAVPSHESQVVDGKSQSDGTCLLGLEANLVEGTQPPSIGGHRGNKVAAVEQYALFALAQTGVGDIDAHRKRVARKKMSFVHTQVLILVSCVAQSVAKRPLLGDACTVVVGTFHGTHFLALLEVVVGQ